MDSSMMAFFMIVGMIFFVVIAGMAGCPKYEVYSATHTGQAELARAEGNRKILILQAEAEKESAKLRAEAIEIVGKAAKDYPEYRTQEFIGAFAEALKNGDIEKMIYVPTEANIPIIERRP